jgi:hypothetical protein
VDGKWKQTNPWALHLPVQLSAPRAFCAVSRVPWLFALQKINLDLQKVKGFEILAILRNRFSPAHELSLSSTANKTQASFFDNEDPVIFNVEGFEA